METLALLELLDRDGSVRRYLEVKQWPVRIGRDIHCDLVLDDVHVAAEHAQISMQHSDGEDLPGRLQLTAGPSINGVQLQGSHLVPGQSCPLQSGDEWQLGRTRMRLRLASAPLAPEQALQIAATQPAWVMQLTLLAVFLWVTVEAYVRSDPDGFGARFARDVITICAALSVWAALWSLVTKLFQHRLDFWRHVWLAALTVLAANVLSFVLASLAYASSLEFLGRLDALLFSVLLSGLIYAHLLTVQPKRRNTLRWFAGSLCALILTGSLGMNWYHLERLGGELYLSTLFPPSLRLSPSASVEQFLDEAKSLQLPLERKAKEPVSGFSGSESAPEEER